LLLSLVAISISSCDLGNLESSSKGDVTLGITYWSLPDTSVVSTPYNLIVESLIENTCVSDLHFTITQGQEFEYAVVAMAVYENHGEACYDIEVYKDSTVSITPTVIGKYYYYFVTKEGLVKDSIYIKP